MGIFRSDGNHIFLNAPYCEFYIPMYYFDTTKRFAEDLSDKIRVLGIFNVGIFENGILKDMKTMNVPVMIELFVYDTELREVSMTNGEVVQCKVLKYLKDAKIMQSVVFEDDTNAKNYLRFITSGSLPSIIPYSKALQLWVSNQKLSGVHFGVSSLYLEMVLSAIYRNPSDLSQKFSKVATESGDYDYATASIRQICQYTSTFTALTFEDFDSMVTSSLNKSREKIKENESPVEQVIKF